MKKYSVIYADPPWPYAGSGPVGTGGRGADFIREFPSPSSAQRYGAMSLKELASLLNPSLVAVNAHLYLWTTNGFIEQAHAIARAWGFAPKTVLTWVKIKQGTTNQPSMKTGYYYRGSTEHILFAVRGSLPLSGPARPTAYFSERLRHSKKPEWAYQLIEEQSPGPYLELFARDYRDGWDVWGNEVESDVELKSSEFS